jgi:TonB family protein
MQVPWGEFRGRLWVNFEIAVPHNFNLDVQTQAGNVEMDSVGGRVSIFTAGGNVQAERIGGAARIETLGGHISVQDVGSELTALTQGGHISIGHVRGDATVRTGGGHVRVSSVQGVAQLESGGGNIYLEKAGANVTANTLGGRIDFGEASGGIRARTGGGSIGVLRVAGPTEIESSGGSISLTNVQGSIRASTASGPITAWFVATGQDGKLKGPWQLESGQGDIIVFIPRAMAITVDATIESPAENRIEADQELPIKVTYATSAGRRPLRGKAVLNGGGDLLRLRTVSGNIRLRYSDSQGAPGKEFEQQAIDQLRRSFEIQRRVLEQQLQRQTQRIEREVEQKLAETQRELSRLDVWGRKLQFMWSGSVRVPEPEQRRKLVYSLRPVYPAEAREQRVQGLVRLELTISAEGKVESMKAVQGHPLLVPAAMNAARHWRYSPTLLDGKAIPVVTSVNIAFKLD